ncbi:hypothetical protein GURASL_13090 [Geotalea uraniireducens]|uniref:TonB C-terminal domain-containing protein n=1 Tax=Geotalea uraniireducens TaxID=351604 RepID=A0ABN6VU78_9BACT|nr:energy transducer TonB [Geotalea uraniireducens]BDV42386.1 hypothetical protein GURASL_13090 [Geotalea uraniireducens]
MHSREYPGRFVAWSLLAHAVLIAGLVAVVEWRPPRLLVPAILVDLVVAESPPPVPAMPTVAPQPGPVRRGAPPAAGARKQPVEPRQAAAIPLVTARSAAVPSVTVAPVGEPVRAAAPAVAVPVTQPAALAPPAASSPPAGAVGGGDRTERPAYSGPATGEKERYLTLLRQLIEGRKEYPAMARRGRLEGTVRVRFAVARDGTVRAVEVARSSGVPLLDAGAVRAVNRAGAFPPLPAALAGDEAHFEVPLVFSLSPR